VARNFLAFDLGAESGRALRASLHGGVITLAEVCRFPNGPVRDNGSLRWDIYRLWHEMRAALARCSDASLESIGVDAWGCDYGLLREDGSLIEPPFTYRDARTDGVMEQVFAKVSRDRVYSTTGIQFLWFNTLYQLYAACRNTPEAIAASHRFATIPDILNLWLSGTLKAEYTNATTTQCVDAVKRTWARELLEDLDIPTRLLPEIVEPGTVLGQLRREADRSLAGVPIVTPACHDTGSAFTAVPAGDHSAFLSSGTWSLLGTELSAPVITPRAMELDFTNEGGVCGTTRLLKNIGGLWLLQSCRRSWAALGRDYDYEELVAAAGSERPFHVLLDPDSSGFRNPDDMVTAIDGFCRQTGQPSLVGPPSYSRAIMESLAFKYRAVLESLEEVTGRRFNEIRVVGGGARNRLLSRFTADATGRTVIAGPVEATALGNVAMQMLATGVVTSLAEARAIIDRSFSVERFEPVETDRWEPHYQRFRDYQELTCA
jgi:rhamnulokinase